MLYAVRYQLRCTNVVACENNIHIYIYYIQIEELNSTAHWLHNTKPSRIIGMFGLRSSSIFYIAIRSNVLVNQQSMDWTPSLPKSHYISLVLLFCCFVVILNESIKYLCIVSTSMNINCSSEPSLTTPLGIDPLSDNRTCLLLNKSF